MYARKLLAGAATAALVVTGVSLTAGPAFAAYTADPDDTTFTPVAADLVGVGSDTSQHALKLLADAFNATTPAAKIATYAATGGGTLPVLTGDPARPNGSGAGKNLLHGGTNNTSVDFARSSSANNAGETSDGLQAFPFALDTLIMVTDTTSNAPVALTGDDIVKIYNGTYTNWNQVAGGTAGVIAPKIPQNGSGTRSFFVAQLKALNGGVDVTLAGTVVEVQEHEPAGIAGNPNAIAPFSQGRNTLLATPLRPETGFSANRALYNVVRGADVGSAPVQAAFGDGGYLCSTAARSLIEQAGFKQLARAANGGVCGAPTQAATSNFTLNEQVVTTTTLTVTSTTPGKAKLTAVVTGSTPPSGTVSFYKGATLLQSNVPLTSGQAVREFSAPAGSQTYRAVFVPTGGSQFEGSEDEGTGSVKVASTITETLPASVEYGKKAKGAVTVTLTGTAAKAVGSVVIKEGSKVLLTKALANGTVTIKLPKFKDPGKHTLTITWPGDANGVASSLTFKIKEKKKKNK
jgi:ABC-type phosphate transport system substrate-binding protein